MQFLRSQQIHHAASKEEGRYAMHNINYQPSCSVLGYKPALLATDGKILAVIPVLEVDDLDTGGMLPADALKAAHIAEGQECRRHGSHHRQR